MKSIENIVEKVLRSAKIEDPKISLRVEMALTLVLEDLLEKGNLVLSTGFHNGLPAEIPSDLLCGKLPEKFEEKEPQQKEPEKDEKDPFQKQAYYYVHTDGSCLGNPGPGGWAAIFEGHEGAEPKEISGNTPDTTNNQMEIVAAIEALKATPLNAVVHLYTDSNLVVNTMNCGWKKNKNIDLWDKLEWESSRRNVTYIWEKGHAGNRWNERANELAQAEAAKIARIKK